MEGRKSGVSSCRVSSPGMLECRFRLRLLLQLLLFGAAATSLVGAEQLVASRMVSDGAAGRLAGAGRSPLWKDLPAWPLVDSRKTTSPQQSAGADSSPVPKKRPTCMVIISLKSGVWSYGKQPTLDETVSTKTFHVYRWECLSPSFWNRIRDCLEVAIKQCESSGLEDPYFKYIWQVSENNLKKVQKEIFKLPEARVVDSDSNRVMALFVDCQLKDKFDRKADDCHGGRRREVDPRAIAKYHRNTMSAKVERKNNRQRSADQPKVSKVTDNIVSGDVEVTWDDQLTVLCDGVESQFRIAKIFSAGLNLPMIQFAEDRTTGVEMHQKCQIRNHSGKSRSFEVLKKDHKPQHHLLETGDVVTLRPYPVPELFSFTRRPPGDIEVNAVYLALEEEGDVAFLAGKEILEGGKIESLACFSGQLASRMDECRQKLQRKAEEGSKVVVSSRSMGTLEAYIFDVSARSKTKTLQPCFALENSRFILQGPWIVAPERAAAQKSQTSPFHVDVGVKLSLFDSYTKIPGRVPSLTIFRGALELPERCTRKPLARFDGQFWKLRLLRRRDRPSLKGEITETVHVQGRSMLILDLVKPYLIEESTGKVTWLYNFESVAITRRKEVPPSKGKAASEPRGKGGWRMIPGPVTPPSQKRGASMMPWPKEVTSAQQKAPTQSVKMKERAATSLSSQRKPQPRRKSLWESTGTAEMAKAEARKMEHAMGIALECTKELQTIPTVDAVTFTFSHDIDIRSTRLFDSPWPLTKESKGLRWV